VKGACRESDFDRHALALVGVVGMIPFGTHIAAAAIAGVLAFGAGWQVQGMRYGEQIADMKTQQAQHLANARKQALDDFTRMQGAKDAAIEAAEKRAQTNAARAAAARADADSLRAQLAGVPARIAAATDAAVRDFANVASDVLGECIGEYQALAEKADQHANNARLMREAWPRKD
jgi:hypothetical protein